MSWQFSFSLPGSRLKLGNTIINFQKLNHGWKLWSLIRALRKCDALAKLYVGGRIIVEDMRAPANSVLRYRVKNIRTGNKVIIELRWTTSATIVQLF